MARRRNRGQFIAKGLGNQVSEHSLGPEATEDPSSLLQVGSHSLTQQDSRATVALPVCIGHMERAPTAAVHVVVHGSPDSESPLPTGWITSSHRKSKVSLWVVAVHRQ